MKGPIRPAAWIGRDKITGNIEEADAARGSWMPLYVLGPDDIAAVNAARKARAWRAARDSSCGCDHNESCLRCWPAEFRPGGLWHGIGERP